MKKHMVWTSDINITDWIDYLQEMYPEVTDENEQYQLCVEANNEGLNDARFNLNMHLPILAIADIGRWNGRVQGYKVFKNLKEILYTECDGAEWYVEGNTLKGTLWDYDGTTYVKYYQFNEELPGAERFLEDIANGKNITKSRLYHYCKSAGKLVKKVYGW